jgi:hypothetical protein
MLQDIIFASVLIVVVFAYIIHVFNDENQNPPFA